MLCSNQKLRLPTEAKSYKKHCANVGNRWVTSHGGAGLRRSYVRVRTGDASIDSVVRGETWGSFRSLRSPLTKTKWCTVPESPSLAP